MLGEIFALLRILLQDAIILVVGFAVEFAFERWLHTEQPFFRLAINISSAVFLLLYGVMVTVHVVHYVQEQFGTVAANITGNWIPWGLAAAGVIAAVIAMNRPGTRGEQQAGGARPVERFVSALPPNTMLNIDAAVTAGQHLLAISPDGRRLAYIAGNAGNGANSQIHVRSIDSLATTALAGTDGAINPFFSPDGEWLGFFSGGLLKKISVSGGAALTLGPVVASPARGGTWAEDGTIIFGTSASGLMRVASAGGETEPFTTLQPGELTHRWPQFLPDGKTVLFTVATSTNTDDAQIAVQQVGSKEAKVLIRGGTYAHYVPTGPTGQLIYYRAGTLMAVPFDPVTLEVKGNPAPVIEAVLGNTATGVAQYSVSNTGSLIYVAGTAQLANANLVWVNRQGVSQALPATSLSRAPALARWHEGVRGHRQRRLALRPRPGHADALHLRGRQRRNSGHLDAGQQARGLPIQSGRAYQPVLEGGGWQRSRRAPDHQP